MSDDSEGWRALGAIFSTREAENAALKAENAALKAIAEKLEAVATAADDVLVGMIDMGNCYEVRSDIMDALDDSMNALAAFKRGDQMTDTDVEYGGMNRDEIIARVRRQRAEINGYFLDLEHWNSEHPGHEIDPDPDGLLRKLADSLDRTLAKERHETSSVAGVEIDGHPNANE